MIQKIHDWWRTATIYQIYPRSFQDSNGDGVGDLRGIVNRLDYVAALGVDAIWVSPFFTSPMRDFGYDVSNFYDVDPLFGTLADADALIAKAASLGIKIIIDMVLNHTSDQHPWFQESASSRDNPKADWYVWADPKPDGTPPNNWISVFGGSSWQWHTKRRQYYLHNFLRQQPDLNYHCEALQQELLRVMEFWLKRGVKGFRFDAANFYAHDANLTDNPPHDHVNNPQDHVHDANPYGMQQHVNDQSRPETLAFLKRVRTMLDTYPDAIGMAEIGALDAYELIGEYTSNNEHLHMGYGFQFLNEQFSAAYVTKVIRKMEENLGDGWACWAFSNHDAVRPVTRWKPEIGKEDAFAQMLLALLTSLRGSICVYQGEELGLPEADIAYEDIQDPYGLEFWPDFKGRDGCRTPMPWDKSAIHAGFSPHAPWLPIPTAHAIKAVSQQCTDDASPHAVFTRLIAWRKKYAAFIAGSIKIVDGAPDNVVMFIRESEGKQMLACFNLNPTQVEVSLKECASHQPMCDHPLTHTAHVSGGVVTIKGYGAYSAFVFD